MKTVFQYYIDAIAKAKSAPNFVDKQLGGRRRHHRSHRNKKRRQRRTYKQAYKRK